MVFWRSTVKGAPLILTVILLGALAIPLVVLPQTFDAFRLPKELALRAEAVLLVAAALASLTLGWRPTPRLSALRSPLYFLPLLALAWLAVVTLTSTNHALSITRLIAGVATLLVYFATVHVADRGGLALVAVPLAAASFNAVVGILQELHVWMPFGENADVRHHLQCSAFIGNPNEVGSYLAIAALVAMAAAAADRARRAGFAAVAVVLVAGVIASQTLTALGALIAGAFALFALVSRRHALRVAVAAALVVVLLVLAVAPLRQRATNVARWLRDGDYNAVVTDRLTPFAAASLMARDRPLFGVGPGAFAWNYYDYKVRAEQRVPALRKAWSRGVNFGEVHNDHLQVLAEGGVVGYALFAAILVVLGALSIRHRNAGTTPRCFAMLLALPLAVSWAVLSIAQFPLETTAVRMLLLYFAALCVAWRAA